MTKRSPLVKGLFDKFKKALSDEVGLVGEHERVSRALADARETKKLCAALLRKEGFDVETIEPESGDPILARMPSRKSVAPAAAASTNGHLPSPLNTTHAVYLIIRKHENAGLTPEEIARRSEEVGMKVSLKEALKVYWTQSKKDRMEKLLDGRIRLTPEGEKFDSFRRKNPEPSEAQAA